MAVFINSQTYNLRWISDHEEKCITPIMMAVINISLAEESC